MKATALFRKYFLPGLLFQSVVIAGGYGTGRELVEFFLVLGPVGGLLAMLLVATVIWSLVCAVSFEFARVFRAYDYRSFFKRLLGRWWFLFEICYAAQLMLVLAVVASAAGTILLEMTGLNYWVGVFGMVCAVGYLAFRGTETIERFLALWSFLLYGVYLLLFGWAIARFGGEIKASFASAPPAAGWLIGGVRYAAYNLALVPAILFGTRHLATRREAVGAGFLAGPLAMIPAFLFFVVMVAQYPAILERPVPANAVLEALGARWFQVVFQVVLFGTLIETGAGMIHAVNERIAATLGEREGEARHRAFRPLVAVVALGVAAVLSGAGLVDLIARGYGTLTWFFLAVFVIPVLTWGVWMLRSPNRPPSA